MNDLSLNIDVAAGSEINRVCEQAQRLADLCGINVRFVFNAVNCMAAPGGCALILAERQQVEQSRKLRSPIDRRSANSRAAKAAQ